MKTRRGGNKSKNRNEDGHSMENVRETFKEVAVAYR